MAKSVCPSEYKSAESGRCIHYIEGSPGDCGLCSQQGRFLCLVDLETMMPVISHSSKLSFIRCRQKYYLGSILGLRIKDTKKSEPLKLGTIWDKFKFGEYTGKRMAQQEFYDLVAELELMPQAAAKIHALIKAYINLGIKEEEGGDAQKEFHILSSSYHIKGFIDCDYGDHFTEDKLSARPDFYESKHNLTHQFCTYFMSHPPLEYGVCKVVRVPGLRTGKGKNEDETPEAYSDRCYSDIISRPSYYFQGYSRIKNTYGRKYYRTEFPIDEVNREFDQVVKDIQRAAAEEAFWKNYSSCYVPAECEFLKVCETGVVSEELFEYRDKKINQEEMEGSDESN